MKTYIHLAVLFFILVVLFGVALPDLINSKSDLNVFLGFGIIILLPVIIMGYINKLFPNFVKSLFKKEKNDE